MRRGNGGARGATRDTEQLLLGLGLLLLVLGLLWLGLLWGRSFRWLEASRWTLTHAELTGAEAQGTRSGAGARLHNFSGCLTFLRPASEQADTNLVRISSLSISTRLDGRLAQSPLSVTLGLSPLLR